MTDVGWSTRVSAPSAPYSANLVLHWGAKAKRAAAWRAAGRLAGGRVPETLIGVPAFVRIDIPFGVNRRRDPHNYVGTIAKPIIDGLVDAGVWLDDTPEWVTVIEPKLTVQPDITSTWHGWVGVNLVRRGSDD